MNTKHLKAKILDLAIRGKLVPQDSSEGNAADLLQKIREEKSELIKQKKIKEDKNASFIIKADDGKHYEQFADGSLKDIEDEIPFEIPENWCWCRLSVYLDVRDGTHDSPKFYKEGIPFVTSKNLKNGNINFSTCLNISKEDHIKFSSRSFVEDGDILMAMIGSIGNPVIVKKDRDFSIKNVVLFKRYSKENTNMKYVNFFFQYYQAELKKIASGGVQSFVGLGVFRDLLFPLPPLSEQQRIVSAIEKAFEQIDIIEKNKLNLKTYIKQTKSKVLDLAIHGKLVEQNPQEGNAFELLEKIRNEKVELIKQKKIKEDKNTSFIIKAEDGKHYEQFADGSLKDVEDEIPFEIPENWCWCRLDSIATIERGGSPRPISHFLTKNKDGVNWIKIGDTKKGDKYIENVKEKIIPEGIRHSRLVHAGDFLLTNSMSFGRPYILKVDGCIHDGWLVFGDIYPCITSDFLFQLLSSPFIYESFTLTAAGSTVKNLNIDRVKQVMFPLPPLSEQKRIVAKIEQVFEQLDVLEKSMGE